MMYTPCSAQWTASERRFHAGSMTPPLAVANTKSAAPDRSVVARRRSRSSMTSLGAAMVRRAPAVFNSSETYTAPVSVRRAAREIFVMLLQVFLQKDIYQLDQS